MDSRSFVYTFTGYIRPEYPLITIDPLPPMEIHLVPDGKQGELAFQATLAIGIVNSQIIVSAISEIDDVETIGNYTEPFVQAIVDSLGYVQGKAIIVQLTAVSYRKDGETVAVPLVVGVMSPQYIVSEPVEEFDASDLVNLLRHSPEDIQQIDHGSILRSNQLRHAVANVREAMHSPDNTALLCYRAIENIRQCFSESDEIGEKRDRKSSWSRMGSSLRFEESYIDDIRKASVPQRHGSSKYMSGEQRTEAVKRTRIIIDRFIVILKNDLEALPEHVETLGVLANSDEESESWVEQ